VIAALGYVIKIILDFYIRKREIKFEYLYKEKAKAFQNLLTSYQTFRAKFAQELFRYQKDKIPYDEKLQSLHNELIDEIKNKIDLIYMYCSEKEKQELDRLLKLCRRLFYDLNKAGVWLHLSWPLKAFDEKTREIIESFKREFTV